MKVVHVNKADSGGGAAVAAARIHAALLAQGVDSSMLVQTHSSKLPNVFSTSESITERVTDIAHFLAERITFLPHERIHSDRFNFSPANFGRDIVNEPTVQDADIIHLHWINQGFLSLESIAALATLNKPIVWTLHDMWPFTGGCHYAGTCLEFNERCAFCPVLRHPSASDLSSSLFRSKRDIYAKLPLSIVTCSQWLLSLASASALLRKKKSTAIPNPISFDTFHPIPRAEARKALGLPVSGKILLFGAARVNDMRKGFRFLQEALSIISNNFPSVTSQINIVTFGRGGDSIPSLLAPFQVKTFPFVGSTQTLVNLYNAADAFILPSLQDNLPNTVVESLACGTPVVGFRIGGVPEMIVHGHTGYLAEPKNSLSLANGIYASLFFDKDHHRQDIVNHATQLFSEYTVANQYIKVYEDALRSF